MERDLADIDIVAWMLDVKNNISALLLKGCETSTPGLVMVQLCVLSDQ